MAPPRKRKTVKRKPAKRKPVKRKPIKKHPRGRRPSVRPIRPIGAGKKRKRTVEVDPGGVSAKRRAGMICNGLRARLGAGDWTCEAHWVREPFSGRAIGWGEPRRPEILDDEGGTEKIESAMNGQWRANVRVLIGQRMWSSLVALTTSPDELIFAFDSGIESIAERYPKAKIRAIDVYVVSIAEVRRKGR